MPGVSSTTPPSGSGTSSRCEVVCRPRPSSRTSFVASTSSPTSALTSVDLPTPEDPRSAAVRPWGMYERTVSTPSPCGALTAWTGTPNAIDSTSSTYASTSSQRSAFVSRTTGCAPLSHASVRNRSIRRMLKFSVETADDEDDVDVRRDDLRLRLGPRHLADERASPRQDRVDRRATLVRPRGDGQPVADGRMLFVVAQAAGELGAQLAEGAVDDVLDSVLDGRARGHEAVLFIRVERLGERRVPAQGLEIQRVFLLKAWVPGSGR